MNQISHCPGLGLSAGIAHKENMNDATPPPPTTPSIPQSSDAQGTVLSIELPKPKISWLSRLLSVAVGGLILYLLTQFLVIRVENKAVFSWWSQNEGVAYTKYFSIFLLYAYYQGSSLLYWIISIFHPSNMQLNSAAITFISAKLLSFLRASDPMDPSKQLGILTPKQLCQTVLLYKDDGDQSFAKWLKDHPNRRQGKGPLDPKFYLKFPRTLPTDTRVVDYTNTQISLEDGTHGVYPMPRDYDSWRGCLQAWANGGLGQPAKYVWKTDAKNQNIWTLIRNDQYTSFDEKVDPTLWFMQPDNFLGRYNVNMDSPFVTFYVTGTAYLQGVPDNVVDGPALDNLIGANLDTNGADPGGWLGFIKGKGDNASADDFYNILYETVDTDTTDKPDGKGDCNKAWNIGSGIGVGVASSLTVALPMMATNPLGLALGILAVLAGGFSGWLDGANKC